MPMFKHILSFLFLTLTLFSVSAQSEMKDYIIGGNNLYHQKDYGKAELQYKQALSKDANSIKANYNLGNALYHQGKLDEARAHYQKVINNPKATKQDKSNSHYNIGRNYLDEGRFEEATKHFKEALKLNPYDDNTRENYAYAKKQMQQQKENQEGSKSEKNSDNSSNSENQDSEENQQKDENKGSQNQNGQDGENEGKGNRPQEQQITKGSDGKGEESPESQTNEYHEGVLRALEQQEQETLKKIISQKAKKVRTNTEKDW